MIITISIQNEEDAKWLAPLLEAIASRPNAQVNIQKDDVALPSWPSRVQRFLSFAEEHAQTVEKVNIPNREQRNER